MNNLHISLTDFRNESRVLKQTQSIIDSDIAEKVFIATLQSNNLEERESISSAISLRRFKLVTRKLPKSFFAQLFKYLEFLVRVVTGYRNKKIGMVNIHALGLLPLGYLLKVMYGAKLIYDTHELETETNGSSGLRKKFGKLVEKWLIKKVDHVFVVSENIADWYAYNYNIPRPTVVLNAPKFYVPPESNIFRDTFNIREDQIIILYQGGLNSGRGVDLLMSAFVQREDDRVVIVFMGYGELESSIKKVSSQLNRVYFHKAVATTEVLDFTVAADVGIHMIRNTCLNHYFCMPNKLFEYAMAGLPVIVSDMKEMREFVEEHDMGIVVEGEDVTSINEAIDHLLEMDLSLLKVNARRTAETHAWAIQQEKMICVYKGMFF